MDTSKAFEAPPKFDTEGRRLLDEWLKQDGAPTASETALAMGVSRAALADFRAGDYRPKSEARERLEVFSGGRISADSWLTDAERSERDAVKPFVRSVGSEG